MPRLLWVGLFSARIVTLGRSDSELHPRLEYRRRERFTNAKSVHEFDPCGGGGARLLSRYTRSDCSAVRSGHTGPFWNLDESGRLAPSGANCGSSWPTPTPTTPSSAGSGLPRPWRSLNPQCSCLNATLVAIQKRRVPTGNN